MSRALQRLRPGWNRTLRGTALAILAGAALLTWPAALNRYPILFSDTGGLLEMGLQPSIGWDKPFVYGPLIAALSLHLTLWLPLIAQAALLSYILWTTELAFAAARPLHHVALCLVLAALTAAPWFTSTLMPDVLTPVAALGIATNLGALPRVHRLATAVLTAVAIAAHLSHLVLAAAAIAALVALRQRVPWRPLASLAAALLFLLASNWIGNGRLAVSPYGSVFALARLIGDGPARDYLDRTCPQSAFELCAWRDKLTSDSDQFLWNPESPFWADPMPLSEFAAQANRIVLGTIRTYPLRVLKDALRNGAHQLVRTDLADTLGPDYLADAVRPRIERWYPQSELLRFDLSRQLSGDLAAIAVPLVPMQRLALALGLLACAYILLRGLRSPSVQADFAAFILIALAANALATGALSTVHDRYEARIAWLVVVPPLLRFGRRIKPPVSPPRPETSAPAPHSHAAASP
jgi:hypothetical protein